MSISNSCISYISSYYPVLEYIEEKKISIVLGVSGAILGDIFATTALFVSNSEYSLGGNLLVVLTGAGGGGALFSLAGKVIEGYQEAKKTNFQLSKTTESNEDSGDKNIGEAFDGIDLTDLTLNKV